MRPSGFKPFPAGQGWGLPTCRAWEGSGPNPMGTDSEYACLQNQGLGGGGGGVVCTGFPSGSVSMGLSRMFAATVRTRVRRFRHSATEGVKS